MIKNESYKQLVKFGLVGCLNTAIDWSVYFILTTLGPTGFPFFYALAKSAGYFCGIVNSFFFNRAWTFQTTAGAKEKRRFLKFVLVNLLGLGINTVSFSILLNLNAPQLLALFLATAVTFIVNFILSKFWVFRKRMAP